MTLRVSFQVIMGSANPGELRTGSVADLYRHFFDIARMFIPPFAVFNEKLAAGRDDAGEHGIHVRWIPCQLSEVEYAHFHTELSSSSVPYYEVDSPQELVTWEAWSWWIYTTQIPRLPTHSVVHPTREERSLRRQYRKALASGNTQAAHALLADIRKRYDPSFS